MKCNVWLLKEFKAMKERQIKDGHGFILVYSITNESSLNELIDHWNELLRIKEYSNEDFNVIVVGNKCDQEEDRVVNSDQGRKLAKSLNNSLFMESSAKYNINVDEV